MADKITIVGVGALGSHVVLFLRNLGVPLKVIDFDKVEQRNTQSQFHGIKTVGKSKVSSIQQTLDFLFKSKIEGVSHQLVSDNLSQLLGGSQLVIDCVDNAATRRIIQGYVREHNIPCLHGAVSADGSFGQVIWDESFRIDQELAQGGATCENGDHLPFITLVSSLIAKSAQDFVKTSKKNGYQVHPNGVHTL